MCRFKREMALAKHTTIFTKHIALKEASKLERMLRCKLI